MLRPSIRLHAILFVLAVLPVAVIGFLGGAILGLALGGLIAAAAAAWLGAVGTAFVIAVPIGAFAGAAAGSVGLLQVLGLVLRLIPARCPDRECRGTAYLVGGGSYRCVRCAKFLSVDGISGTSGPEPRWIQRFQERRIDRAMAALSARNVEGRLSPATDADAGGLSEPDPAPKPTTKQPS